MTDTGTALLSYVAWTLFLLTSLGLYRTSIVMGGKKKANAFNPSGEDIEGFGRRLTRAHANCYENLPAAAAVMLYAIATGQTVLTDPLAYILIGARILQSVTHLTSTSSPAVTIRFAFFIVQIAVLVIWLVQLF